VQQFDSGAVAQWSALTLGAATVTSIARSPADGAILLFTADGTVFRMPDAATLQTYGAPLSGAFGANGSTLYAGGTAACGQGDSDGGVLYEVRLDGTLRWVSDHFCGTRVLTVSFADGRLVWADPAAGGVMAEDGIAGGGPAVVVAPGSLTDPRFVIPLADGSLLVPNRDTNGQYEISHYDASGNLLDAAWSPDIVDAPDGGVLAGANVVLSYASTQQLLAAPAASGGPLVAFATGAFRPAATALSVDVSNDLVISDPTSASVWVLPASGSATLIAQADAASPWFYVGDGRLVTVDGDEFELVMP